MTATATRTTLVAMATYVIPGATILVGKLAATVTGKTTTLGRVEFTYTWATDVWTPTAGGTLTTHATTLIEVII